MTAVIPLGVTVSDTLSYTSSDKTIVSAAENLFTISLTLVSADARIKKDFTAQFSGTDDKSVTPSATYKPLSCRSFLSLIKRRKNLTLSLLLAVIIMLLKRGLSYRTPPRFYYFAIAFFATVQSSLNAFSSEMARSARTLRFKSTPATFRPCINWE